jgi:hypothetical protein
LHWLRYIIGGLKVKAKERVETAGIKFWSGNVRKRIEFSK